MLAHLSVLWLSLASAALSRNLELFTENLSIRPLSDGKLLSTFTFNIHLTASAEHTSNSWTHSALFPLSLAQILRDSRASEIHKTLATGKWDYLRWGLEEDVASGSDLWAWLDSQSDSLDSRWLVLRTSLGGLFCNTVSSSSSIGTSQKVAFSNSRETTPYSFRKSSIASGNLCTENLVPIFKLLPCNARAGLAELLNPHALLESEWHGMAVHLREDTHRKVWNQTEIDLKMILKIVANPARFSSTQRDWSFQSLYRRVVNQPCPASTSSIVHVLDNPFKGPGILSPEFNQQDSLGAVLDLASVRAFPLNIKVAYEQDNNNLPLITSGEEVSKSPVLFSRALHAASHSRLQTLARLHVTIINRSAQAAEFVYSEALPPFCQVYLHTMKVNDALSHRILHYSPSPHIQPTSMLTAKEANDLSLMIVAAANSTITLTVDVELSFLKYTEYVPDAQRGVDIPGAVLHVTLLSDNDSRHTSPLRVVSSPLLITLPVPDFSMPYNVIVMTSTVLGFMFANTFNLLLRRLVLVKIEQDASPSG